MSRPPEIHDVKKRLTQRRLAAAVLERHPRSYADELGVGPLDTPSGLFKLLVVALLMSARIHASVAADIFFRDVQAEWHELYPFADRRALDAARHIGLPASAAGLARLAPGNQLVSLLNALVRMDLEDTATDVRRSASLAGDRGPDFNVTRAVAAPSASA